jgi:hypothetical protein
MWSKSSKIFAENHYYDLSFTNIVPVFLGILLVLAVINIKYEENSLYFSGKGREGYLHDIVYVQVYVISPKMLVQIYIKIGFVDLN